MPARRAAFTLVELMIVIAIMAILMAIVIPGYKAASEQNQRNVCASNLKAVGQALALFREDYQCYPPDATEYLPVPADPNNLAQNPADVVHAVYDSGTGEPINTGVRGMGLYTLYYLGAYSSALPPVTLEPEARLGLVLRTKIASKRDQGLNALTWFRSGGYISNLKALHCPSSPVALKDEELTIRSTSAGRVCCDLTRPALSSSDDLTRTAQWRHGVPILGGWGSYDWYYRRNFWNPGHLPGPNDDQRNLCQAYPPADTVITWCTLHRSSKQPPGPGVGYDAKDIPIKPGDRDMVLFADGSVHRMVSRQDNRTFEEPKKDTGWPAGPIM